jgi:hypothetical protein
MFKRNVLVFEGVVNLEGEAAKSNYLNWQFQFHSARLLIDI